MDYFYGLFCCIAGYLLAWWIMDMRQEEIRQDHYRVLACIRDATQVHDVPWGDAEKQCAQYTGVE